MNSLKKIPASQIIRHVIQLVAFILYPGLFISLFSALRSIVSSIIGGSFSLQAMASQIFLLLAIFPITILWGRFFCGFLCSFGAMGDLIYFLAGKLGLKPLRLSPKADDLLRLIKYAILAANLVLIWILGYKVDSSFSPWSVFGLITAGHFNAILVPGLALLVLIIAASALIERFFCRYLCPLGALFSLLSVGRFYRIKRDDSSCTGCTLCSKKCSMGIDVHNMSSVYSGECIDCMKCIEACPKKSLKAAPGPAVAGTAAALATLGLVSVGQISSHHLSSSGAVTAAVQDDGSSSTSSPAANGSTSSSPADTENGSNTASSADLDIDLSQIADGTFTGSGSGFRGTTEVSVTVKDHKITDITITSYQDDQQFFESAEYALIPEIIGEQSIQVDAVSGATYSCNGILEAVADALGTTFSNPNSENPGGHSHGGMGKGGFGEGGMGQGGKGKHRFDHSSDDDDRISDDDNHDFE